MRYILLEREVLATTQKGDEIVRYTLRNDNGIEAAVLNYGGILQSLRVPDRDGKAADIVLGFDELEPYLGEHPYFGAIIGRVGNRIAHGKLTLNGRPVQLTVNSKTCHLHGGKRGFDKVLWKAAAKLTNDGQSVELHYVSPAGSDGYPGRLSVTVNYVLTPANELRIQYAAQSDADTIVNLTNHSYFNLAGAGTGDVLKHEMQIFADQYTPVDGTLIPTGELRDVAGTPFDFREPTSIGAWIDAEDEQIRFGSGYDHNYVLRPQTGEPRPAARVRELRYGVVMEVLTTEPGLQFYSGNFLDVEGKGGRRYGKHAGFCLETQHFPDAPNHPHFPSIVLKARDWYRSTTIYRFPPL
ncbi:MAG: galactose mutarotase [Acidobacteria bacterium]|nr:galactose mutarotase [Acidobacteriota bacterium]